jgi:hypothetical protein
MSAIMMFLSVVCMALDRVDVATLLAALGIYFKLETNDTK